MGAGREATLGVFGVPSSAGRGPSGPLGFAPCAGAPGAAGGLGAVALCAPGSRLRLDPIPFRPPPARPLRAAWLRAVRRRSGQCCRFGRGRALRSRIKAAPRSDTLSPPRRGPSGPLGFAPCAGAPGSAVGLGAVAPCAPGSRLRIDPIPFRRPARPFEADRPRAGHRHAMSRSRVRPAPASGPNRHSTIGPVAALR